MSELDDLRRSIPDPIGVIRELRRKLERQESNWEPLAAKLSPSIPSTETMPSETFDDIRWLLGEPRFLREEDSWLLVDLLRTQWDWMLPEQRDALRGPLTRAFDAFAASTGAFVISEILGERYCDSAALEVLSTLGRGASLPAKALVPHGLEVLAMSTQDQALRAKAVATLRDLASDEVEDVQSEARLALAHLDKAGTG